MIVKEVVIVVFSSCQVSMFMVSLAIPNTILIVLPHLSEMHLLICRCYVELCLVRPTKENVS